MICLYSLMKYNVCDFTIVSLSSVLNSIVTVHDDVCLVGWLSGRTSVSDR